MDTPLADRLRPKTLDDVVGQKHLLGEGKILRRIVESKKIPNLIFYGPSGTGKTTVARIIADTTKKRLHKLNGTNMSIADIKRIVDEIDTFAGMDGIVLYLDEIQYLNKKQQQSLLEYIENGDITLIASTTENPYFYIYNAVLSRSTVFEFKAVDKAEVERAVKRAFKILEDSMEFKFDIEKGCIEYISLTCGGDVRKAINTVELLSTTAQMSEPVNGKYIIKILDAKELSQRNSMRYDKNGEEHYDLLSALQKSIRGSDADAAIYYLARILSADDLISACRRLLVIASEDIGLARPQAAEIVKACVDSAMQLGLPEARIPLAHAAILLATSPKSNSAYTAINKAMDMIEQGGVYPIPRHLQNKHFDGDELSEAKKGQGYKYPHDYENHYVKVKYLPDKLSDEVFYEFGDNKNELAAKEYWKNIKK